jgi:hypothetical protein
VVSGFKPSRRSDAFGGGDVTTVDRIVDQARTHHLARAAGWSQSLTEYLFRCGKDPGDGVDYLTGWAMGGIEDCLQDLAREAGWSWGLIHCKRPLAGRAAKLSILRAISPKHVERK